MPHLPDFLEDHTLVGERKAEKVAEILQRQVQFIESLWRWQNAAFSLRYIYHPERVTLQVALLARVKAKQEHRERAAQDLANHLHRLAHAFGLPFRPVTEASELHRLLSPFSQPAIIELRQHEEVVRFTWLAADAYVVYPLRRASGSFLAPFLSLGQYDAPILINLHIQPTQLSAQESQGMAHAAGAAQTAADMHRQRYDVQQSMRYVDPQAQLVAQIYSENLRRFHRPFLTVAQVASLNPVAAMTVAQSLVAAITARDPDDGRDLNSPPAIMDAIPALRKPEAQAAQRTLHELTLAVWGAEMASEGKERYRYLTDARGAACLFRFPISVQGGIPGIVVRQQAPAFVSGERTLAVRDQELHLGAYQNGGQVTMPVKALTRHGLIAGLPGSGKTNTCLYLLDQLWRQHGVPFMVIEPAKSEYRGLIRQPGYDDLLIFTLGDETTSPFRFNPFELLPDVRVEAHLEMLNVAINAAMPQFGVLPTIIEEALENVYRHYGWELTDRAGEQEERLFPTLADFYRETIRVVQQRGYRGELNDNITAAVKGRIGSLLRGSKGFMFNCRRSLPLEHLLSRPVILEMDALSDDAKSLAMMFLLILLREYRRRDHVLYPNKKGLRHLLLIEEAHRIMENVQSVGPSEVAADTRAKAVKMITDFLVEMRAYGQGMLIAEQSPEKLAPDAVRNTNLKIAHMLPGRQDREALAAAMIMDEQQELFMGKLRVGQAAVFMTGFEKATFMRMPNYKDGVNFVDHLLDDAVAQHMQRYQLAEKSCYLPFDGCRFCGEPCQHRMTIEPVTRHRLLSKRFQEALLTFDHRPEPEHWPDNWRAVAGVCLDAAERAGRPNHKEAAYCYFAHEIDFPFT
ncbi:MAG: ATP-binding protein, partial [Chloroflexi bacterium]|nr:ATP-binding protein [Chloroflexota bacterium]